MVPMTLDVRKFAWILLAATPLVAAAQENAARAPLVDPGDKYVALTIDGCADKCPSFEIYVFENGRMAFRPNNQYSSTHKTIYKNGSAGAYNRIAKYLEDSGSLNAPTDCADRREGSSTATVVSSDGSTEKKASWSGNCANQAERGRALAKVFVNQTAFWRNINSDTRYWQEHWETWVYPNKAEATAK
jgi:hypothetical protein